MAKKTRSEAFYERKAEEAHRKQGRQQSHKRRKKRSRSKAPIFLLVLGVIVLIFSLYQLHVRKPEVTISKAISTIKDGDLKKQEDYFDKISNINEILGSSYSEDEKEKDDFLKANYSNLDVKIKSQEKTEKGVMVHVEVSNINFIEVLDTIKNEDTNFHRTYIDALEKGNKNKKEAKLLLKRRFSGYKIYESREFVDAILGGALENK